MVDRPVRGSSFKPCGILNSRSVGALLDKRRTFYKVRSAKEASVLVHATETFKRSYFFPLPFREEESCLSTPGMPEQWTMYASETFLRTLALWTRNTLPAEATGQVWRAAPRVQWNQEPPYRSGR